MKPAVCHKFSGLSLNTLWCYNIANMHKAFRYRILAHLWFIARKVRWNFGYGLRLLDLGQRKINVIHNICLWHRSLDKKPSLWTHCLTYPSLFSEHVIWRRARRRLKKNSRKTNQYVLSKLIPTVLQPHHSKWRWQQSLRAGSSAKHLSQKSGG